MTTHTLQSLLPLLDTPEGLEKLRIITAEADGWFIKKVTQDSWGDTCTTWEHRLTKDYKSPYELPNYPASLDAIFAAEERLGLHDSDAHGLFVTWTGFCSEFARLQPKRIWHCTFLTAAQRCVPFILTVQEVRPS